MNIKIKAPKIKKLKLNSPKYQYKYTHGDWKKNTNKIITREYKKINR